MDRDTVDTARNGMERWTAKSQMKALVTKSSTGVMWHRYDTSDQSLKDIDMEKCNLLSTPGLQVTEKDLATEEQSANDSSNKSPSHTFPNWGKILGKYSFQ